MTHQSEVAEDPKYISCLDHGFVGLVDSMGSDHAVVQAARVSYGAGTKTVNEDRGLIRYLMRLRHTSPIEMCEVKLHIKLPIFVMRQLIRHRTSSLNEYSGRYSIMTDEFYIPAVEKIQAQSTDNKQGRGSALDLDQALAVQDAMNSHFDQSYDLYNQLTNGLRDRMDKDDPLNAEDFPGIARETARAVLPVAGYTELYWKQNLHNMLHLLKLRRDSHAQYEIRVFAEAIFSHIQPLFPIVCEAWEDYVWNGLTLSRMERDLVTHIFQVGALNFTREINNHGESVVAQSFGMSAREFREFRTTWGL